MLSGNVGYYCIIKELRHRDLDGSSEVTQPNPEHRWRLTALWVLVALPGIKWDCIQALAWAFWTGLQSQVAAVILDREAEAGVSECLELQRPSPARLPGGSPSPSAGLWLPLFGPPPQLNLGMKSYLRHLVKKRNVLGQTDHKSSPYSSLLLPAPTQTQ